MRQIKKFFPQIQPVNPINTPDGLNQGIVHLDYELYHPQG